METPSIASGTGAPANSQNVGSRSLTSTTRLQFVPALSADVAVITNIGPSHLEGFGTERGVAREKMYLLDTLSANALAVLHADDPWSQWIALHHRGRKATFGRAAEATLRASDDWANDDGIGFELADSGVRFAVPVCGSHQVSNCLAAVAVAAEMGIDARTAAERFASFAPLKWRMVVHRVREVTFILDCYNANPASVRGALAELARRQVAGRRVAVLGDMLELGHIAVEAHAAIGRLVVAEGIDLLCAVGELAEGVADAARGAGMPEGQVFWTVERGAAAQWLRERVEPGDAVLVKGSRGVRLEEVAEALDTWVATRAAEPAIAT